MARVLMLTSTLPRSQSDTSIAGFVFDLAKELSQNHGHTIRILAPHIPGTPTYEIWDGVEIVRFRYFIPGFETLAQGGIMPRIRKNKLYVLMVPFFLFGMLVGILLHILRHRPSIVHAHWLFPQGVMARVVLLPMSIRFVVTSHGSDLSQLKSSVFRTLYRWVLSRTHSFTVVSKDLAELAHPLTSHNISVIPMGIRSEFFTQPNQKRQTTLVSVGRLDWDKGFQDVIEALVHLPTYVEYSIIGEGNARQDLLSLAKERGVSERVHLLGSKSAAEIKALFDTSSVFVHPSRHEGFGLVVVEAMASQIPVITSDIPTLRTHTDQGRGISVPVGDIDLLTQSIEQILSQTHPESINTAHQYSLQYQWNIVAKKFDQVYQEVV